MTRKQLANIGSIADALLNIPKSMSDAKSNYEKDMYNQAIMQEGARNIYGGRNMEIGNLAPEGTVESETAINRDIYDRTANDKLLSDKNKQAMDELNNILASSRNDEGLTDKEQLQKLLLEGATRKSQINNAIENAYPEINLSDMYVSTKEKQQGMKNIHEDELSKIENDKKFYEGIQKGNPAFERKEVSPEDRSSAIEKTLLPFEAKSEKDIKKYAAATGDNPELAAAMEARKTGRMTRKQYMLTKPYFGAASNTEAERNIDVQEKPAHGTTGNKDYDRTQDTIQEIGKLKSIKINDLEALIPTIKYQFRSPLLSETDKKNLLSQLGITLRKVYVTDENYGEYPDKPYVTSLINSTLKDITEGK